tara:strand:- start:53 stop:445 length:393 start_codon:yes stop_codon:yes gene_type:complete
MKITLDICVNKQKLLKLLCAYVFIIIIDVCWFYLTRELLYPHLNNKNFNYIAPFFVWLVMSISIIALEPKKYEEVVLYTLSLGFVLYMFYNLFSYIVDQSGGIGVIFYDTLYGMTLFFIVGSLIWLIFDK